MAKKQKTIQSTTGATERAPEGANGVAPKRRRWSASRKLEAVMCLLRGQSLDAVSRKYGVSLHELSSWRDKVLNGAEQALKTVSSSDSAHDNEKKLLLSKIGEITMDNELLKEKIKRLENGVPFHLRR